MPSSGSEKRNKTSSFIAHKRTPTASWKDDLRRACLDRARQRRRQERQRPSSEQAITLRNDPRIRDYPDDDEPGYYCHETSAQALIQEELNQFRVTVRTPSQPERGTNHARRKELRRDDHNFNNDHQHYSMTEEEWIELIQEVEEEMERAEALQLEQALELDRSEEQYWQEQIAHFDEHEYNDYDDDDYHDYNDGTQVTVVCPICHEANLTETTHGDVVCPNHMDGSCLLHLSPRNGLTRQSLCHALSLAYQEHARYCNGNLFFEMEYSMAECPSGHHLNAVCSVCQYVQRVV